MTDVTHEADRLVAVAAASMALASRAIPAIRRRRISAPDAGEKLLAAMLDGLRPDRPVSVYRPYPVLRPAVLVLRLPHQADASATSRSRPMCSRCVEEIATFWQHAPAFRRRLPRCISAGARRAFSRKEDFARLRNALGEAFRFEPDAEISIELDPSDVTAETLEGLRALGATRASVGVQDFDPVVQEAINRPQSFEQTRDVVAAVRGAGIASVNIDVSTGCRTRRGSGSAGRSTKRWSFHRSASPCSATPTFPG